MPLYLAYDEPPATTLMTIVFGDVETKASLPSVVYLERYIEITASHDHIYDQLGILLRSE